MAYNDVHCPVMVQGLIMVLRLHWNGSASFL